MALKSEKVVVIHNGVQSFFETKRKLEITMVKHVAAECIEIIAYDPLLDIEAERIYVNTFCLGSKLSSKSIKDTVIIRTKSFYRKNPDTKETLDKATLMNDVTTTMSVAYLLARLKIPADISPTDCVVYLHPFPGDDLASVTANNNETYGGQIARLDFQFPEKPDDVTAYQIARERIDYRRSAAASTKAPYLGILREEDSHLSRSHNSLQLGSMEKR